MFVTGFHTRAFGDLWQDLRYARRIFSKQPAFAATAVLTLALGIGATTAIFSVVYGVLLKPLPFHEPERLVSLTQIAPHGAGANHGPATLGVSMLGGALIGLFAVFRFGAPGITALKEGARSASDAPGRHHARTALVVGQVAVTLMLLIAAGLMIRTFIAMRQVDPGFTGPGEVQTFVLDIPDSFISDPQQAVRAHERVAERLRKCRA